MRTFRATIKVEGEDTTEINKGDAQHFAQCIQDLLPEIDIWKGNPDDWQTSVKLEEVKNE